MFRLTAASRSSQMQEVEQLETDESDCFLSFATMPQVEEYTAGPGELVSGVAAHRVPLRRVKGEGLRPKGLPTPSELIGRRRMRGRRGGRARRGDVVQQRVATVLQHITDLKKRQSAID
ncbi:hypothetical protein JZ751_005506, partial [Albula glossodonta]